MDTARIAALLDDLTTPHVADACLRAGVSVRCAPHDIRPVGAADRVVGRVRPARHAGSVDVFLDALERAAPGDVLVVDNAGRRDEACVGDLVALETREAGLAGIIIWGLHRDTAEIRAIGLPVFSLGVTPSGPLRVDTRHFDALQSARIGDIVVGPDDVVMGDVDGVLFIPMDRLEEIAQLASQIRDTERIQAQRVSGGVSLRAQLQFDAFTRQRSADPDFTFRQHLRRIDRAIEE